MVQPTATPEDADAEPKDPLDDPKNRKKFDTLTEEDARQAIQPLGPKSFDPARFGHEGFKATLLTGRIDCLPSGVHLWCDITPEVLQFLDWIFVNGYGLKPASHA